MENKKYKIKMKRLIFQKTFILESQNEIKTKIYLFDTPYYFDKNQKGIYDPVKHVYDGDFSARIAISYFGKKYSIFIMIIWVKVFKNGPNKIF